MRFDLMYFAICKKFNVTLVCISINAAISYLVYGESPTAINTTYISDCFYKNYYGYVYWVVSESFFTLIFSEFFIR